MALLNAVVIGGGICGLSVAISLTRKGHKVTVLESSTRLTEFGAGIQISPNATRILSAWGVLAALEKVASNTPFVIIHKYSSGEQLLEMRRGRAIEDAYGFPHLQFYRPDLQRVLAEHLKGLGVEVQFGSRVRRLACDEGRLWLENGTSITGDLIVCADGEALLQLLQPAVADPSQGIRSGTRAYFPGKGNISPMPFNELAYRAVIPAATMATDPDTAELMSSGNSHIWFGSERAVVTYTVARGALFNLAVNIPRQKGQVVNKWVEKGDVEDFRSLLGKSCPMVQKIARHIQSYSIFTLAEIPRLSTWWSGKAVLVGDAAHAMSPLAGQGAAMAIEDAAVLGECLNDLSDPAALSDALRRFEAIRQPRVERVAEVARVNASQSILPDGPEQEARDNGFRAASKVAGNAQVVAGQDEEKKARKPRPKPDMNQKWGQPGLMMWLYGADVIQDAISYGKGVS